MTAPVDPPLPREILHRSHIESLAGAAQVRTDHMLGYEEIADLVNAIMVAYCTRGIPEPVPHVVRWAALGLARRWVENPSGMRTVAVDGQSVTFPAVGFSFLEQMILSRYRFRSA